jgi:hypothetical protein
VLAADRACYAAKAAGRDRAATVADVLEQTTLDSRPRDFVPATAGARPD